MNHLLRSHAPITDIAWSRLDAEGRERLVPPLAVRKLVDFSGPYGWEHSATNLGRVSEIKAPDKSLQARQRRVLPLAELRAPFAISRAELLDADRGATDLDLAALDGAARCIAVAENIAVFHGWADARIVRITEQPTMAPSLSGRTTPPTGTCRQGRRNLAGGRRKRSLWPRPWSTGVHRSRGDDRARRTCRL